jgi:hypothetical protein
MKVLGEKFIRKRISPPYEKMLDLWGALCKEEIGQHIEIFLADRHEHPNLKHFKGTINTALPRKIDNKLTLVVYLDSVDPPNWLILTHEVGHWILKLKGFKSVRFENGRHSNLEILFNSFIHHTPLYKIQKELGIDPQEEIDSRAENHIFLLNRDKESVNNDLHLRNALLFADDLISCTPELHEELFSLISQKHPKTFEYVKIILETATFYDLNDPKSHAKFAKMLIKKLNVKKDWSFTNEVYELKIGASSNQVE